MKFQVPSKELYNLTSAVSKIISSKTAIQILNNFLLTLEGDTLTVKAEDMENYLLGRINVTEAEGSGSFCMDAMRLVELLKLIPSQGITFEVNDKNEVEVSYSNGRYRTMAINGDEFPSTEANEDAGRTISFTAPASVIIHGMESTIFAVGNDEIRPQLNGVLWDIKPDKVIFVSTDTRTLVRCINTAVEPGDECSFILPLKGANILKNVFSGAENIKVTVSSVNVVFESEDYTFDCRLIKGNYPDYDRVIPKNNPYTLSVDCQTFLSAVRRVAIGGDEGSNLIKFTFENQTFNLSSVDAGYNTSGFENVPCNYDGPNLVMGFDGSFLIDILSTFKSSDVMMCIADPSRPALLTPVEKAPDTELSIILMPMNIIA